MSDDSGRKCYPAYNHLLFVVSSPSGGGKTTLVRECLVRGFRLWHSISYTTREKRSFEISDQSYHFISDAEFKHKIAKGDFIEYAFVHGHYYGTERVQVEAKLAEGYDIILDIDVQGAQQIRKRYSNHVSIFVLPPSPVELERRLRTRDSDSVTAIDLRLKNAKEEVHHLLSYDYLIINDQFEDAVDDLCSIITAERLRISRQLCDEVCNIWEVNL